MSNFLSIINKYHLATEILNENSFNTEDCILILRIFLSKLKRLLKIKTQQQKDKNLDNIISSFRPPIFWKEKEIVKQQIKKLEYDKIKELIIKTNNIEFLIKKNPTSSIFIVSDFTFWNIDRSLYKYLFY